MTMQRALEVETLARYQDALEKAQEAYEKYLRARDAEKGTPERSRKRKATRRAEEALHTRQKILELAERARASVYAADGTLARTLEELRAATREWTPSWKWRP